MSDTHATAHIRILNASPNAPAVDVFVNDQLVADDLAYTAFTEYMPAEPGIYSIRVMPTGLNSVLATLEQAELLPGEIYTMAVIGVETDLSIELIPDSPRTHSAQNRAFMRFINLSPYDTEFDIQLSGAPVVTMLNYTESSDYVALNPGTYHLKVFNSRDNRLVLTNPRVPVRANHFYAAYIVGLERDTPPLQVLLPLEGVTYLP